MAVTANVLHQFADTTNQSAYTTGGGAITPAANKVILALFLYSGSANPTPSMSGCNLTWTEILTQQVSGVETRVSVFRGFGAAPTTGNVTFTTGAGSTGCAWAIVELDGVDIDAAGAEAIAKSFGASINNTAGPSITMDAWASGNAGIAIFGATDSDAQTAEGGWTVLSTQTHASPDRRISVLFRTTEDATPSLTTGDATNDWAMIAVELQALSATVSASIAQTLPPLQQSALAQQIPEVRITWAQLEVGPPGVVIAQTLPALQQSMQVTVAAVSASIAQTLPPLQQSALAVTGGIAGPIAQSLPALQQSMSAQSSVGATIAQTLPALTQSISAADMPASMIRKVGPDAPIRKVDGWFIGEDTILEFYLVDHNGNIPNITNWSLEWILRLRPYSLAATLTKTTPTGIEILNGPLAICRVKLTDEDTLALAPARYYHTLKRSNDGLETVWIFGDAVLRQSAAR